MQEKKNGSLFDKRVIFIILYFSWDVQWNVLYDLMILALNLERWTTLENCVVFLLIMQQERLGGWILVSRD